jgi:hypothetical protein
MSKFDRWKIRAKSFVARRTFLERIQQARVRDSTFLWTRSSMEAENDTKQFLSLYTIHITSHDQVVS